MPVIVQLALVTTSGRGARFSTMAGDELVGQVRMRAAVAAALGEREMLRFVGVVDPFGREAANALGQTIGEVGHRHALGLFTPMQHRRLVLDARPLERDLVGIDVEALEILPSRLEQAARSLRHTARESANLNVARLDGERRAVFRPSSFSKSAPSRGTRRFRPACREGQAGADAVRGVVHRRQPFPIAGPAGHLLLMRATQKLQAAQLAALVKRLDEQELAAVDDGLHHHVVLAARLAALDRCRHSSTVVAIGTVQATCLPAFSPARLCGA